MKKLYTINHWSGAGAAVLNARRSITIAALGSGLVCCLLLAAFTGHAQGIYQFWGITDAGGDNNQGVLFSARYDGSGIRAHSAFTFSTPGANPLIEGLVAWQGRLYGMMPKAGKKGAGIIYEYDPKTFVYTKKLDLHDYGLRDPEGSMQSYGQKLYGICSGGQYGKGALFEYDPAANALVFKHSFQEGTGTSPAGGIVIAYHEIYGIASSGGPQGGVLYAYNLDKDAYKILADFPATLGWGHRSHMMEFGHTLYGITSNGGAADKGIVYRYNLLTNTLGKMKDMADIGAGSPVGPLVRFYNGNNKLYGITRLGGAYNAGVIFEYDMTNYQFTKKLDLTPAMGDGVAGGFTVYNDQLYYLSTNGGAKDHGELYHYDPVDNKVIPKWSLYGPQSGSHPKGPICLLDDKFYFLTYDGGANNDGALLEYDPATNGFFKRVDLGNNNGYRPSGKLTYYSGKLYGITNLGGNNGRGVIYAYDLATRTYAIRYHMNEATGNVSDQGGMVLFNNRLYGVTMQDANTGGVLYEFNPLNDQYTVLHYFDQGTGVLPEGVPVYYKGKLYGTTTRGGDNKEGVIYEYDLATKVYSVKVTLGGTFGAQPATGLTLYNDKLYGTCTQGGTKEGGTLFAYIPQGNGYQKLYDFDPLLARYPTTTPLIHNNKLYGTTVYSGNQQAMGSLYEYDLASGVFKVTHDFMQPGGFSPYGQLAQLNGKLYGTTFGGGDVYAGGVLYEYDPVMKTYREPSGFNISNGLNPRDMQLTAVPALVAPGDPGSCMPGGTAFINTTNATQWIPFTDDDGNAVLEINANGNILGNVAVHFYTHNDATRKDAAGRFFLDRNLSITVDNQPTTPVSVRFYVRKSEFDQLKNTTGAGILNVSDLTVFHTSTPCANSVGGTALPVASTVSTWGLDYVFTAQVPSFSSFYFASKAYAALPVKLAWFRATAEATANQLNWKAECTEPAQFIIERSTDGGQQFKEIGEVAASVINCGYPLQYLDAAPPAGKAWYRLQMREANGAVTYSVVIMVNRAGTAALQVKLMANPVAGSTALCSIESPIARTLQVAVYSAGGSLLMRSQWQVMRGVQVRPLDVQQLTAGVYHLVWADGTEQASLRFVKR